MTGVADLPTQSTTPSAERPDSDIAGETRGRGAPRPSVAIVVTAVFVAFGAFRLLRDIGHAFTPGGDVGFIELGVYHAVHGGTALGVYSRFGWFHPGPALYYLLAPAYVLSGESSRSLFFGVWLINGGAMLGAVALVRARGGELAARITAGALFAYFAADYLRMINPWNPRVLAAPMFLFFVCVAATADGSVWAPVVAIGTASYLVQAHLGTLPLIAVLAVLAIVAWWHVRRHTEAPAPLRTPALAGGGLFALMWIAPLYQQFTSGDGNLRKIASFYLHPARDAGATSHSLHDSFLMISNVVTTIPLSDVHDNNWHTERAWMFVGLALLGVAAGVLAYRRSRFVAAFAFTTPVGLVVSVIAATRVVGDQFSYLFYWTQALPLPAIIAAVWLLFEAARQLSPRVVTERAVAIVTAVGLVVIALVAMRDISHRGTGSSGDMTSARAAARRIEHEVGSKKTPFTMRLSSLTIERESMALQVEKDGFRYRLDQPLHQYAGNAPHAHPALFFDVRPTKAGPPTDGAYRLVGEDPKVQVFERIAPAGR